LFNEVAKCHTLIVGATGAGKTTLMNNIICEGMQTPSTPTCNNGFLLLDPKMVSFGKYKTSPLVVGYADDRQRCINFLRSAVLRLDKRKKIMQKHNSEDYVKDGLGGDIYICVDELMDLALYAKKEFTQMANYILSQGRATGIHMILCTQCPQRKYTDLFGLNCSAKIALHCTSAIESRLVIGQSGAELLRQGEYLIKKTVVVNGQYIDLRQGTFPYLPPDYIQSVVDKTRKLKITNRRT